MKKLYIIFLVAAFCLCACRKVDDYEAAVAMMEAGNYEGAIAAFSELGDYEDSVHKMEECRNILTYLKANQLFDNEQYEEALTLYLELGNYEESMAQVKMCESLLDYWEAVSFMEREEYEEAVLVFRRLGNFEDSAQRLRECEKAIAYKEAMVHFNNGNYEEALAIFERQREYRDSTEKARECIKLMAYAKAEELFAAGKYEEALAAFTELLGYGDSEERVEACKNAIVCQKGIALAEAGEYTQALEVFKAVSYAYRDETVNGYVDLCNKMIMLKDPLFAELEEILGFGSLVESIDNGWIYSDIRQNDDYRKDTLTCEFSNYRPLEEEYTFEMGNGSGIKMPMTFGDLYEAGWRVEETRGWSGFDFKNAELSDMLPGKETEYVGFINSSGKGLYMRIRNPAEEPIELRSASVEWFGAGWNYSLWGDESELKGSYIKTELQLTEGSYVMFDREAESFVVNGISKGSEISDIIEEFGWPYSIKYEKFTLKGDSSASMELIYYGNPEEKNEGYMVFAIGVSTGKLSSIEYAEHYVGHHI